MLFNSLDFAIFLPIVFFTYWFLVNKNLRLQNLFILIASYIFYGWWDWRFLSLIFISSLADYIIGIQLSNQESARNRKLLLSLSILINIGFLGFFKYYNFFVDSFVDAFSFFGHQVNARSLNILLPVGISFYTFQTLSYSIDIYRGKLEPTKDIVAFFAFVSFFPQLVAGPIERAANLLPQFNSKREFDYHKSIDGMRQILWGLFKKIVIADNCAIYVNDIFTNYSDYSGATLMLGGILFAFQVYGDFSGYSDIAIGTSRLFGFNLMRNFAFPFFSRDMSELWRRWHISLTTWFRDYVYIPLGGSRGGMSMIIRNTFIVFIVSGFWHGAEWTFVLWGFLCALFILPQVIFKTTRVNMGVVAEGRFFPSAKEFFQIVLTFTLFVISVIVFRSENIPHTIAYYQTMFTNILDYPEVVIEFVKDPVLIWLMLLLIVEWVQREKQHGLDLDGVRIPRTLKWGIYYSIIFLLFYFGGSQQEFIYFQF